MSDFAQAQETIRRLEAENAELREALQGVDKAKTIKKAHTVAEAALEGADKK